jgi:cysteine desulfurase/selenocysteine lyase
MTMPDPILDPGAGFADGNSLDALARKLLDEVLGSTATPAAMVGSTAMLPGMSAPAMPASHPFPSGPVPEFVIPPMPAGVSPQSWNHMDACDPFMSLDGWHTPAQPAPPVLPTAIPDGGFYFLDSAANSRSQATPQSNVGPTFDVEVVRRDFPILHKPVNGKLLIWLDNGATTQKPRAVIEAIRHFYENDNSNVHRAAHTLAARATEAYEDARKTVQGFIGASSPDEIIFTRGTTEAINLAAQSLGAHLLSSGDEILLATLEHHANIVPWQMIAARTGAKITPVPIDDSGQVILEEYYRLLSGRTKIVALSHVSNVLGTVLPLDKMIGPAHKAGAKVLIDGAQSIAHVPVNVTALDADLFAFSGHKIYGPTGVGVLYGKLSLLEEMPPWQGGGNMIENVSFEKTTFNKPPAKFEAGTTVLAGAVGLAAALRYIRETGFERILAHEDDLLREATRLLSAIPGLKILGTASEKVAVLSFSIAGISPDEIGKLLTAEGIAIRVGHHCAQPVLRRYGFTAIARASLGMYNTLGEIQKFVEALYRLRR